MDALPMATAPSRDLDELVADALARAAIAHGTIRDEIVPMLPPRDRSFAEHIARALRRDRLFEAGLLTDLETFAGLVGGLVRRGTVSAFVPDASPECFSPHAGWTQTVRTPEAGAPAVALIDLRDLIRAIGAVQDRVVAARVAHTL